jgi:AbrB family looped-hinge helix DNA binding protein
MAYGIIDGMTLRIDKAGRIVVPKPLRERFGLKPDTELEAVEQSDGVLLRPVEQRLSMIQVDGLWGAPRSPATGRKLGSYSAGGTRGADSIDYEGVAMDVFLSKNSFDSTDCQ